MITIWGGATGRTIRAHWMAHEVALDYEPKLIGSRTGETQSEEFKALNVKEKIPVLIDGDFVLTESAAIVTYLGDTYGLDYDLVPPPMTKERAKYNEWLSYIQMELDAHTLYIMRKHRDLSAIYGEAPAAITAAIEGFQKQIRFAERQLSDHKYLISDTFSAADLMLTSVLTWAKAYGIALSDRLESYSKENCDREAYQKAAKLNFSISAGA